MRKRQHGIIGRTRHWPVWLRRGIGLTLILLSIPGIFLPVLQFWLLVIPGVLLLLGPEHRVSRWLLARFRRVRARLRLRRARRKKSQ
ncbi:MAG: hypothetical protein FWE88_00280 [Phycisphaerae bacterium]|nr:hypothetical protein [Phycisphaerae bacterium]